MTVKILYLAAALFFLISAAPAARAGDDFMLDYSCLAEAYPGIVQGVSADSEGRRWIVAGGRGILYDDRAAEGRARAQGRAGEDLERADLKASMAQIYPLEPHRPPPAPGFHPGRARSYDFMRALYGATRKEVEGALVSVPLAGKSVKTSGRAGLPAALAAVNAELAPLLSRPDIRPYVLPVSGGYFYRKISGEQRLSPHAFGLAVDLNPKTGPYWRWAKSEHQPARMDYPTEIVSAFEKHGFIWGGKWREYDLMHFEYRPELICKARKLFSHIPAQDDIR